MQQEANVLISSQDWTESQKIWSQLNELPSKKTSIDATTLTQLLKRLNTTLFGKYQIKSKDTNYNINDATFDEFLDEIQSVNDGMIQITNNSAAKTNIEFQNMRAFIMKPVLFLFLYHLFILFVHIFDLFGFLSFVYLFVFSISISIQRNKF